MKKITLYPIYKFVLPFLFIYLIQPQLRAQTMTFDTNLTVAGFTLSGLTHSTQAGGVAYPEGVTVNDVITIAKDAFCFNFTSMRVSCWAGNVSVPGGTCTDYSNGVWKVWSNKGDEQNFSVLNENKVVIFNWVNVQWVKIQLITPDTNGTPNDTFDLDDIVYTVPVKTVADTPTVTANPNPSCPGVPTTLSISGDLNDATHWIIYTGSCGGTKVGETTSSTFDVSPTVETTYYVRGEDECGCVITGNCNTVTVSMKTPSTPLASVTSDLDNVCTSTSVLLTANGGTTGTGALIKWYSGTNGSGTPLGSGTSISVAPTNTASYYVRREGDCNSTSDATIKITVDDIEVPTVICQDYTLMLDVDGNGSIIAANVDNGSIDNCSTVTLSISKTNFTLIDVGDVSVTLTVEDENSNSDTCIATVTVQANSLSSDEFSLQGISIFPMTFNDHLNIRIPQLYSNSEFLVQLFNIKGQTLLNHSEKSKNSTFKITNLNIFSTGLYFLKITNIDEGKSVTKKIIKF